MAGNLHIRSVGLRDQETRLPGYHKPHWELSHRRPPPRPVGRWQRLNIERVWSRQTIGAATDEEGIPVSWIAAGICMDWM